MFSSKWFENDAAQLCKNKRIFVAYSGGVDSHVLLHYAHTQLGAVQAIHINHGLSPNADLWQQHCQQVCDALNVKLHCVTVKVQKQAKKSLEDLARIARRNAWQQMLGADDLLLVAHHAQDQAETILYRLFRGAGPQGLSGMQQVAKLGVSILYRPLLTVAKEELLAYAAQHQLQWITDESNHNQDFDRNYIRNRVLPVLQQRWPAVITSVNRAGILSKQLLDCLQPTVQVTLDTMCVAPQNELDLPLLLLEDHGWQIELLRAWLQKHGITPTYKQILQIQKDVIKARIGSVPSFAIDNIIIARYKNKLILLDPQALAIDPEHANYTIDWDLRDELELPCGEILVPENIFPEPDLLRMMQACNILVASRAHGRKAKKIFQANAVPVWLRDHYPAIYADGKLVAICDLWTKG